MTIGKEYVLEAKVEPQHYASVWGSGGLDVFATPCMIAYMEGACLQLVQAELPEGKTTVGVMVNIEHIKASGLNQKLRFIARLVSDEGKMLGFEVEAYDEDGMIGRGTHTRAVIETERFLKRLNRK